MYLIFKNASLDAFTLFVIIVHLAIIVNRQL